MDLANFDRVQLGSKFPSVIDCQAICGHEQYGLMASVRTYKREREGGYVQFRVKRDEHEAALFTFQFDDGEVPDDWKDAEVLWDSRTANVHTAEAEQRKERR